MVDNILGTVIGGLILLAITAAAKCIRDRVIQRQQLLYKVSHRKLLSVEELRNLAKPLKVTFGRNRVDELYLSSIHFRNVGTEPVEKYPVIVRFGSGARVLQADRKHFANKIEYDPIMEDEKDTTPEQRAYLISLMPRDLLELDFLSTGKNIVAPAVFPRQELLASITQMAILLREDDAQTSQEIIDASIVLGTASVLLIVGVSLIFGGWLREQGAPFPYNGFVLGAGIAGSIGFLVFRLQVWLEQFNKAFGKNKVIQLSDRTRRLVLEPIPLYVLAGVVVVVIQVTFWYSGHGDWNWQILAWLAQALGRLINALLH